MIFVCSIKLSCTPEGAVKLEIEHAQPADCGAYKLVISNPNGENVALCAVAVKRMSLCLDVYVNCKKYL